jgi:nicotinamidase-related amidase
VPHHHQRPDWKPVAAGVQVQVQIEGGLQPVQAQPISDQAAQVILADQAREVDSVVICGFCTLFSFVVRHTARDGLCVLLVVKAHIFLPGLEKYHPTVAVSMALAGN